MTHNIQCVELGKLSVPGMHIKVRWFPEGTDNKKVWRAPANILSFSRVVGEAVQHRDVSKPASTFKPAGPLTFWPHSSMWESRRNGSQVLTVSAYFDTGFTAATASRNPQGILIDDFSMLEMIFRVGFRSTINLLENHDGDYHIRWLEEFLARGGMDE